MGPIPEVLESQVANPTSRVNTSELSLQQLGSLSVTISATLPEAPTWQVVIWPKVFPVNGALTSAVNFLSNAKAQLAPWFC